MRNSKLNWILNMDRIFIKLVTVTICVLLVTQAILLFEPTRKYISWVDRLEGRSITLQTNSELQKSFGIEINKVNLSNVVSLLHTARKCRTIEIIMLYPEFSDKIMLTVNGKIYDSFKTGFIRLDVYEGDYLEIDALQVDEGSKFVIRNVSGKSLSFPLDGLVVEAKSSRSKIGQVKF